MISLIMCGHSLSVASPTLLPHSQPFIHMSPHSSVVLFSPCKLTTARTLTTSPSAIYLRPTTPSFASPAPTRLSRMVAPSASFTLLMTVSARCSFTPTCLLGSGWTRSQPPASSLTFARVVHAGTTLLTSSSSVRFRLMMVFASLGVSVILAPRPLLLTNSLPGPFLASSLVILPTPKVTGVMI